MSIAAGGAGGDMGTVIIDYDAGNIGSVKKALAAIGEAAVLTRDKETILQADRVILPGVGAFGDAMDNLNRFDLVDVIKEVTAKKTPFLGICLGMQLLFEKSEETPGAEGLGLLKGCIRKIPSSSGLKIPHMGWNSLDVRPGATLFQRICPNPYVYFVHSYYLEAEDEAIVAATTEYGVTIHASVESGNIFGCQFHPEKSSAAGLTILQNFVLANRRGE